MLGRSMEVDEGEEVINQNALSAYRQEKKVHRQAIVEELNSLCASCAGALKLGHNQRVAGTLTELDIFHVTATLQIKLLPLYAAT
jgi:hypothetical protein